jgi:2'-5' RNA ligase
MEQKKAHTVRLFVAVPVPGPIAEKLKDWTLAQKEALPFRKWAHPQDYHITLQFLGDTPVAQIEALQAALREVSAAPISLALNGAGTFGPPKAPRVLWTAITGDLTGLTALHLAVVKAASSLGFEPEDRPYTPHITLARGFAGGGEMAIEATANAPAGVQWEADRFVLMQTHMHASPMYEVIGEFKL